MTIAVIKRARGVVVKSGVNSAEVRRLRDIAEVEADRAEAEADRAVTEAESAETSAAFAEEFSGPAYASQGAGEAATTEGQFFRVPIGTTPETYTRYQRTATGSVEAAPLATTADLASTDGGALVGTAPAIGSALIFGKADSRLRYDIDLTGAPFNMRPGADADQSPALTDAVDAWKQAGGERRKIVLPSGKLKWETSADLTGVNTGYFGDVLSGDNRNLTISGAGREQTILVGGEPDYGFMEVTDSSSLVLQDFSMDAPNSGADQCQYAILGGRTTGNASSGFLHMNRLLARGRFTKPPFFLMSVENSQFEELVVWSVLGEGLALAMNNIGYDMDPKYLALGTGLGGNGANKVLSLWAASLNLALPESRLLRLEFTQGAQIQNAYFVSSHAEAHIRVAKRGQFHLDGSQHEWDPFASGLPGALDPISVEFADGDTGTDPFDIPEYRGSKITNSRLRSVYGEDGSKVVGLDLDGSNVLKSFHDGYALNFDTLQDSRIDVSKKLDDVTGNPARVDTQIRTENGGNTFGAGIARSDVVAPFPSLDAFIDVETGQLPGTTGLSTIPGAAVGNSGMVAFVSAPGTASFGLYIDWTVPDLSNLTERCILGLGLNQVDQGGIGTMSMALYGGQLLLRTFGDAAEQIDYRGTADAGFVSKFKGKRIRTLFRRTAGVTVPKLTIDGGHVQIGRTNGSGASLWDKPVTGTWLQVGYQSAAAANNAPAIYHEVAYLNYAPTDEEASDMTRFGLLPTQRWGETDGSPTGCIGYWNMAEGTASRVLDASPLGQHGTIIGTCARLQGPPEYLEGTGSPVGALSPRKVGDLYLDKTVGAEAWFKSYGLGNSDWQAL